MPETSAKVGTRTRVREGILSTLAFFAIYGLPLSKGRLWQLLYRVQVTMPELERELSSLVRSGFAVEAEGMYALNPWDQSKYLSNQLEIGKRWERVERYRKLLALLPFVETIAVINSMAMGNADSESDIDFFVIVKPKRLYFVRTLVILLFKLFGVYKTRENINQQFCFGFYLSSERMRLDDWLLLPGEDPYLSYWVATILPLFGQRTYERFLKENKWIYSCFPNFRSGERLGKLRESQGLKRVKRLFEIVAYIPAAVLEPVLRLIHVRHTYRLPENSWPTSSTVANEWIVKLHALDPRKDLRRKYYEILNKVK